MVPSCWLIPEWIRSYQGLGGPWGLYGASQWQHPAVLALAAVGGTWLVSVALLLANTGLLLVLGALRPALLTGPAPTAAAPTAPLATTATTPQQPQPHAATPATAPASGRRIALGALGVAASPPPPDPARSRSP